MPETSSGTELFAAVSSRFARVRYRVACVVSIPFARTARGPPGPLVIVMRPLAALPLAVIASRLPKVEPGTQTARLPGRERLREPVQRLQRARLRPRVRVRAARRRPQVAAHRDRASSGDPDEHARDDDRRYDRCTPQHGRSVVAAIRAATRRRQATRTTRTGRPHTPNRYGAVRAACAAASPPRL